MQREIEFYEFYRNELIMEASKNNLSESMTDKMFMEKYREFFGLEGEYFDSTEFS